jgi:hypothetical protein
MKPLDPVTVVAAIAIAAFAIDRIVTAFLFVMSYRWKWADPASIDDANQRTEAEKNYKLTYYSLATIFGLLVYTLGNISVFFALGFPRNPIFDALVTVLVLVGGSDRVAALLKVPDTGGDAKPVEKPVEVTGTLTLVPPLEEKQSSSKELEDVVQVRRR